MKLIDLLQINSRVNETIERLIIRCERGDYHVEFCLFSGKVKQT